MPAKADILRSYRELIYVIKRLPYSARDSALLEARAKTRECKDVMDEGKATELHKLMISKIGFLRLAHPRRSGDKYSKAGTFVYRDGKLTEDLAQREVRYASLKCSFIRDLWWAKPQQSSQRPSMRMPTSLRSFWKKLKYVTGCRVGQEPISKEEGMKKHNKLLRRQYFGQQPPMFRQPFWIQYCNCRASSGRSSWFVFPADLSLHYDPVILYPV